MNKITIDLNNNVLELLVDDNVVTSTEWIDSILGNIKELSLNFDYRRQLKVLSGITDTDRDSIDTSGSVILSFPLESIVEGDEAWSHEQFYEALGCKSEELSADDCLQIYNRLKETTPEVLGVKPN